MPTTPGQEDGPDFEQLGENVAHTLESGVPVRRDGFLKAMIAGIMGTGIVAENAEAAEINFPDNGPLTDSQARKLVMSLVGCNNFGHNDSRIVGKEGFKLVFKVSGIKGTLSFASDTLTVVYRGETHTYSLNTSESSEFDQGFMDNLFRNNGINR